jgi:hypothetical protein
MLPQREYIPAIDPNRSLNNLVYPLDWEGIARYVGFPAICKPADGGGWRNVNRVNNMDELMQVYNSSGQLVLTMQQFIEFDDYVRCLVIGREHVRMIRYSVKTRSYLPDKNFLPAALEARIVDSARELNRALGYDMNSVEFAIKDGVPYAIDFTNPAPDMYPHHILADNYEWCLEKMSELCITAAREGRQNDINHSWQRYLEKKTSHPAASAAAPRATAVNAVATAR